MILKNKKILFLFSVILAGFFIFAKTENVFASGPYISGFSLNGNSSGISFNPQNGEKATIAITTNTPVKFNTIAVCSSSDDVCSRTTAVKYFTQTSSYATSVSKDWDGNTGGSSPSVVPEGEYKIKVTMADQAGGSSIEIAPYLLEVNFSAGSSTDDTGTLSSSTDSTDNSGNGNTESSTSTATSTNSDDDSSSGDSNVITKTVIHNVYISTHSDPEDLSDFNDKTSFITSAGRERISYVGAPIEFSAGYKTANSSYNLDFTWSFGDGFNGSGQKVSHVYKYPGVYNVVLNGDNGTDHSVSRTKVTILAPQISISLVENGGIDISNNGKYEINLGGWKITDGSDSFILAKDTIIDSGKDISLSGEDTKISTGSGTVRLENPSGGEVAVLQMPVNNNTAEPEVSSSSPSIEEILGMKIENAEKLVSNYKKIPAMPEYSNGPVKEISRSYGLSTGGFQNTASVETSADSTTTESFIKKIFNFPVRAIKSIGGLFYNL